MRSDFLWYAAVLLCKAATVCAPAHAQDDGGFDSLSSGLTSGTHVGGVAEIRGLWLVPGQEPNGRVQQTSLRLTLEHSPANDHTLVVHAQGQWMHSSNAATLANLREAESSIDRARSLAWQRESERQQRSVGVDWLYLHGPWQGGRYTLREPARRTVIDRLLTLNVRDRLLRSLH